MLSRQSSKWLAFVMAAVLLLMTACTDSNKGTQGTPTAAPTSTPSETPKATESSSPGKSVLNGQAKYDPPISLRTVRSTAPNFDYLPDQTIENNVWTREFESELGIKLVHEWIVNSDQYANKINVTMVSGDMPDFFRVNMQQFQTLAQAGQLADLTDVFDKHASDLVKKYYNENDAIRLKAGTVNGRLLGLATDGGSVDDAQVLYIREDWLKKVGKSAPKTMDELIDVAIAFATEDPDDNGIDDTYGLLIDKSLFGGFASIQGFLNGYGGYAFNPSTGSGTNLFFLKDSQGKAIFADIQPEVKTGLGKLAELFELKAIHPEFSVMDSGRAAEMMTSNKVGMTYGAFFVPNWPINNMHTENPEVDWGVYDAPSGLGSPTIVQSAGSMPANIMVVSKRSEYPEAMMQILNYSTERLQGSLKDVGKYHTIKQGDKNYQIHTLTPFYVGSSETNQNYHYSVSEAFKSGDTSKLDDEGKMYYEQLVGFKNGEKSLWAANKLWNEGGVFATLGKYKNEDRILQSAYVGAPTPTMLARGSALRDLQVRTFTEIIMGNKPIEAFDEFVQQWLDQGGKTILEEVNETGQVQ